MIRKILEKIFSNQRLVKPVEFVVTMLLVYIGWRVFKLVAEQNENFMWGGWTLLKDCIGNTTTFASAQVLLALGYKLTFYKRVITLDGTSGIYFADLCLGIAPMVIFSGFVFAYGNNWRNKWWFAPVGIFLIFCINVLRMVALVLIQLNGNKTYFTIAHDYLYVLVTYGFIFLMVMWWIDRWADKEAAL